MANDWYYTQGHERQGPVSLARLKAMANEGWLTPNDLVWQQGMPNWVPAETVRGLFGSGLLQTLKGAVEGIAKHPTEADSKLKLMPTDTKQVGTVVSTHTATHANNNGPTLDWDNLTPRHMLAGCGGFITALGIAFTAVAPSPFALAFTLGGLALASVGMHVEVGQLLGQAVENIGKASHEAAIRQQEVKKLALEEQKLALEIDAAAKRGVELKMTDDELAFYDALAANESAVRAMGNQELKVIAAELVTKVRASVTIDWTLRENARSRIKVMVKRILRHYGYPPDLQDEAVQTVLLQAKTLCKDWAA